MTRAAATRPEEAGAHAAATGIGPHAAASPIIGVIHNPRSHKNRGQAVAVAARENLHIAQPETRADISAALLDFLQRGVEYVVVDGGDGTIRDVLSCGLEVYEDNWPTFAMLPKGKTNALNIDLGGPRDWTLGAALHRIGTAPEVIRRPMIVRAVSQGPDVPRALAGFVLGAGAYTLGVQVAQKAHRLGMFNSVAVALTTALGVARLAFGRNSNVWRRGTVMDVRLGARRTPLPRTRFGQPDRRALLLASTLDVFPAGLKLFGTLGEGLKLTVLDFARRRAIVLVPAMLMGRPLRDAAELSIHQRSVDQFEITLDEPFVLDGESFAGGQFVIESGPDLRFVVP